MRTTKARCERCKIHIEHCICAEMPRLDLSTRLTLIIHVKELRRPTNTGQLAHNCLPNSEIRIRGLQDKPLDTSNMVAPGATPLLLYPSQRSIPLSAEYVRELQRPLHLIVPDGNWGQASRTASRLAEEYPNIQHIRLPDGGEPTKYQLRKEMHEGGMSTFEAIARTLGFLEGPAVQEELEKIFLTSVRSMMKMRGKESAY
jgi:DTW domain-containing protein